MFFLMKSRTDLKVGHVRSKTRSVGQIIGKNPCVRSRGHIFSPIIMKLDHHICLVKISHKISKTRSLGQILEKRCVHSIGHNFESNNHEIWSECLS